MRQLWSNTRESTQSKEKGQAEDSLYSKGIEVLFREMARNMDNLVIAPQDCEIRQSGRVLELQSKDLWIRPSDLSWHFTILVTIRELPFRRYRGRSLAKLEDSEKY